MQVKLLSDIRLNTFRIKNQSTDELCKLIKDKSFDDAIDCVKRLQLVQTFKHSDYQTGLTPLNLAIQNQNLELIEEILKKGIDPNNKDANGQNAFYYAMESGNAQIVRLVEKYDSQRNNSLFSICKLS